jgi:hypothetical protein
MQPEKLRNLTLSATRVLREISVLNKRNTKKWKFLGTVDKKYAKEKKVVVESIKIEQPLWSSISKEGMISRF